MKDVMIYIRRSSESTGKPLGSVPFTEFGKAGFDPIETVEQWGLYIEGVGLTGFPVSGQFVLDKDRGAAFEIVADDTPEDD